MGFGRTITCAFLTVAAGLTLLAQPSVTQLGPYGGDVRSLAVHQVRPNRFFLGTADGQIFVSEDAGDGWKKVVPGLDHRNIVIDNLAFDPHDPDTLYAAAWELKSEKGWLFRTRDGGKTWEEIDRGRYGSAIRALAIAPSDPKVIALGISEGVIASTDGGRTWNRITRGYRSLYYPESLAFDPQDSKTLYVGTRHLGSKTTNGGESWTRIEKGILFDSHLFSLVVEPLNPEIVYGSACTGIYKSTNGGLNWTRLKNGLPKPAMRTRTLRLDPSNSETIYAGTTDGLFVSHDAGGSWRRLIPGIVVNSIAVHPEDRSIILVGTDDAGVLKTRDGGSSFNLANEGFIHRQVRAVAIRPEKRRETYFISVAFDGDHGGFFVSSTHGRQWDAYNDGLKNAVADIRAILPSRLSRQVYIGTHRGVFSGSPPTQPWNMVRGTRKLTVLDLAFADAEEKRLYLAASEGAFVLDIEGGETRKLAIGDYQGKVNTVLYEPTSRSLLVGTELGLFRSDDGGRSWQMKGKELSGVAVNALVKTGTRLFCAAREGLFSSDDNGESWQRSPDVYPIDVVSIEKNPALQNELYAADFAGHLFFSKDTGKSWNIIDLGYSPSNIAALAFTPSGQLLAGTISDGVYAISTAAAAEGR